MGYFCNYAKSDPKNLLKKRNVDNTPKSEYNCAGYALGCFSWYVPDGVDDCLSVEEKTVLAVQSMLEDFDNIRVIEDISQLSSVESLVVFRVENGMYATDFHYILRAKNGHWFHKEGASSYISTMKESDVFSDRWPSFGHDYSGPIILFAVRR